AANSGVLFLPVVITPAACSRSMMSSSVSGTKSANARDPCVVRIPLVRWVSLWVIGRPCRTGRSSGEAAAAARSSAAAAARYACSRTCVTTALIAGFTASTRAKWASRASLAETSLRRSASTSSTAVRSWSSVIGASLAPAVARRLGAVVDDGRDRATAVRALVGGRDGDEHGRVAGDRGGHPADRRLDLAVPVHVGVVEHRVAAAADLAVLAGL